MNILVCVKQVPDTSEIRIDPVKNTLIRDGVPSILNTFDAFALEQALKLKDADPENVKVIVVSMGPPQAETMLRDCLAVGANQAFLVTDRKFGGSDTLATSYILTNAIKTVEKRVGKIDMIFCGKQAIDGDTAQVGPEIAEQLDIPQVTYGIKIAKHEDKLHVTRELDDCKLVVETQIPCLVTFTKTDALRFPTIKSKMAAKKAEIVKITSEDFEDLDESRLGLKGSPTRVRKTFTPSQKVGGVIIKEDDADVAVEKLFVELEAIKLV